MKFEPLSAQEIFEKTLLRGGKYPFEVLDAKEEVSAAGNEMFHLQVKITANGNSKIIHDYLLPKKMDKLRHAAQAMGILEKFEQGVLSADDFVGRRGKARIGVERDRDGYYAPKNIVVDYVP